MTEGPTDFFEAVYAGAAGDEGAIPWQAAISRPLVASWLEGLDPTAHRRALVVAAGLGDDAAALAERGLEVTAFDASPSAVAWAEERHPSARVDWVVADLFELPTDWARAFDLVLEVFTIQSIPVEDQDRAVAAITDLVAPGGVLTLVALVHDPGVVPSGPPWPLDPTTIEVIVEGGLTIERRAHLEVSERTRCVSLDARRPLPG